MGSGVVGRTLCWPEGQARPQACTLSRLTQGDCHPPPCQKSDNLGQPAPKPVSHEIPGGSRFWVLGACLLPPHPSTEVCSLPSAPHLPQSPQLSPGSTPHLPASLMTSTRDDQTPVRAPRGDPVIARTFTSAQNPESWGHTPAFRCGIRPGSAKVK